MNDLYGWRHGRVIQSGACFSKVPAPACSSFLWIEEVRTSKKVYQELFTSKKKEESKRKVPLVTWKMPKLVKRLAQKQEWCANHDASSRQVIVLKPLFCSLYKRNRFHFAVRLLRSQKMSKCDKIISDTLDRSFAVNLRFYALGSYNFLRGKRGAYNQTKKKAFQNKLHSSTD